MIARFQIRCDVGTCASIGNYVMGAHLALYGSVSGAS
jgi:hypothetical protein